MLRQTLHRLSESSTAERVITRAPISRQMVSRFVAGSTLAEALDAAAALNSAGLSVSLDYLGEAISSREEIAEATGMAITCLEGIAERELSANISLKPTQLGLGIDEELCLQGVSAILERARALGDGEGEIFVRLDMESSGYVERTIVLVERLWEMGYRNVGTVLQSYLHRTPGDVERLNALGSRVRLVKGAYKEPERVAYQDKAKVDEMFVREMQMLLRDGTYPAIATHDEAMIDAGRRFAFEHGIDKSSFEFQMLYGVRRDFQTRLREEGYNVRVYVPFGDSWYPYLMRRLAERPANLMFMASSVMAESPLRKIASPLAIGVGAVAGAIGALSWRRNGR